MLQTAEGAMAVIDDLLVRMKELAEQASTGSYSADQIIIMNNEYEQLGEEITRIAESTTFNGTSLLDNTAAVSFHLGSAAISFTPVNVTAGRQVWRLTLLRTARRPQRTVACTPPRSTASILMMLISPMPPTTRSASTLEPIIL